MTAEAFPIVFPPMDPAVFAAKLAKWNARGPKQPKVKLGSIYGRPSLKRIPREKFAAHIAAVTAGRFHEREKRRPLVGRRVTP